MGNLSVESVEEGILIRSNSGLDISPKEGEDFLISVIKINPF